MKYLFLLILSLNGFAAEVYFTPSPKCENRIVKAIENAKKEVLVAVYSINNHKIVDALKAAKQRGIGIKILSDRLQSTQRTSKVLELLDSGLDVRVHSKFKIEHNKFAIFDGELVSTGSFNWTGAASRSNSENCIFLDDASIVAKYSERFSFLWEKNTAQGSKMHLSKIQKKVRGVSGK
jgi:phosphatidylserine/phosphatidylglycerophosphate/cardiolipin synthase-like enzyme